MKVLSHTKKVGCASLLNILLYDSSLHEQLISCSPTVANICFSRYRTTHSSIDRHLSYLGSLCHHCLLLLPPPFHPTLLPPHPRRSFSLCLQSNGLKASTTSLLCMCVLKKKLQTVKLHPALTDTICPAPTHNVTAPTPSHLLVILFDMYKCFPCKYDCVPHACLICIWVRKGTVSPEQELQKVVGCHVGAGNSSQVPRKINKCS